MSRRPGWWGRRLVALTGVIALVGGVPPASAAGGAPSGCPRAVPIAEVSEGMKGVGYTVSKGTEPEPFDVEVLGVLRNPYMPVRDMIVVEASSPAIERAGGIWFGMSGSPVYVGDRLLGAVAFSLSYGASSIAGLTAAEDMIELMNRPGRSPSATQLFPHKVMLPNAMRAQIAEATGTSPSRVGGSMVRLRLPLSVSALTERGRRDLNDFIKANDLAAVPYAGASVAASERADAGALEPGSNFAAALSYGDVTFAAVGTTTFVCDGVAVAFGHPFFWEGSTMLGANTASAITIVSDPTFGAFKLARVGGSVGTVDQDRFAGIRAVLNGAPRTLPVTSTVTSRESGKTVRGRTDVVFGQEAIYVALEHLYVSILATQDQFGKGSATTSWTIRGTKRSGGTWKLSRSNMYTSRYGIAYEAVAELGAQMQRIQNNGFEPVAFTGLHADISVQERIVQYAIAGVQASVEGGPFRNVTRLRVRPGARIALRVRLEPLRGTADKVVELSLRAPRKMRGPGVLEIEGGSSCLYRCRHEGVSSFAEWLRAEANQDHHNDLLAELYAGPRRSQVVAEAKKTLDRVITKHKEIEVLIPR
jgi:hypothetical protein